MASSEVSCVFCRIVAGDAPAHTVWRNEVAVAFLDRLPLFEGHVLVVPTLHVETLGALAPEAIGPYFEVVRRLAVAVPDAVSAQGSFVAMNNVVSQSVPHLHTHVVPRKKGDGLRGFFWPRRRYETDDAATRTCALITQRLEKFEW
jgi:histidine triad (HIT) family protein